MTGRARRRGRAARPAAPRAPRRLPSPSELAADRAAALALTPVSRETTERLDRFVALLLQWQRTTNLIAAVTAEKVWTRHVADSLQLLALAPHGHVWVDFGAGAGFPGLIIACALAGEAAVQVHLVESNAKKAAFLREAARITGAPALVHAQRIADFLAGFSESPDVVTARALAPLGDLLAAAYPLLKRGAVGLFPKGQDVDAELTEASKCWNMQYVLVPSRTDSSGRIVIVRHLEPRAS